jgi:hypothetical protein
MDKLDPQTLELLLRSMGSPSGLKELPTKGLPANTAGIADLLPYEKSTLRGTNTQGFVVSDPRLSQTERNRGAVGAMFVAPESKPEVFSHEAEHLMAKKQLGHPSAINEKFDELVKDPKARGAFVMAAMDAAPYLKEKYGISNAYFDPKILKNNPAPVALYEQLASLAAAEYTLGVDLTKDPQLRKTLFKDPAVRETYSAVTGLRQTRLDPRDIPPYTRVPEPKAKSLLDKARGSLRMAQGGETKLI